MMFCSLETEVFSGKTVVLRKKPSKRFLLKVFARLTKSKWTELIGFDQAMNCHDYKLAKAPLSNRFMLVGSLHTENR